MTCWHCGKEMLCYCSNCKKKFDPPNAFVERIQDDIIFCGYCGFGLHVDVWTDLEIAECKREQIGAFKGRPYDYDNYVELFKRLRVPLAFSVRRPDPKL